MQGLAHCGTILLREPHEENREAEKRAHARQALRGAVHAERVLPISPPSGADAPCPVLTQCILQSHR